MGSEGGFARIPRGNNTAGVAVKHHLLISAVFLPKNSSEKKCVFFSLAKVVLDLTSLNMACLF